jgi:hypothetical protein
MYYFRRTSVLITIPEMKFFMISGRENRTPANPFRLRSGSLFIPIPKNVTQIGNAPEHIRNTRFIRWKVLDLQADES